jgi:surface antigen
MKLMPVMASAALVLACSGVLAQGNTAFLRDSPIERMTREDLNLLVKNYQQALDRNADGQASAWVNPKTGHSGTAKPLSTKVEKGTTCRKLEFTNQADGRTGRSAFTFCKVGGTWKTSGT